MRILNALSFSGSEKEVKSEVWIGRWIIRANESSWKCVGGRAKALTALSGDCNVPTGKNVGRAAR